MLSIITVIAALSGLSTAFTLPKRQTTIPAECTNIVPSVTIDSFAWFNSTNNLDCAGRTNFAPGSTVCITPGPDSQLCPAETRPTNNSCTCIPICATGVPDRAQQPYGFSSPDTISISIAGKRSCSAANPQGFRNFPIGEGRIDCGNSQTYIAFNGNSDSDTGVTSFYDVDGPTCNSKRAYYSGEHPVTCVKDAGGNATCTAPVPVSLPFKGFF
ncbi:hypothetical protein B9Z65_2510 [Elsinoe australis]|uniref:Uncharacterized protein n=1 Tax=Elsinoe australis TaxID=40998 RepID=A0A2P7ZAY1_9PEZI|nr:hypothetical protein B9Z65_2510 [Elsinoe australis]